MSADASAYMVYQVLVDVFRSSVVGSIGVIFGGLGFHELINKYGIGEDNTVWLYLLKTSTKYPHVIFNILQGE